MRKSEVAGVSGPALLGGGSTSRRCRDAGRRCRPLRHMGCGWLSWPPLDCGSWASVWLKTTSALWKWGFVPFCIGIVSLEPENCRCGDVGVGGVGSKLASLRWLSLLVGAFLKIPVRRRSV